MRTPGAAPAAALAAVLGAALLAACAGPQGSGPVLPTIPSAAPDQSSPGPVGERAREVLFDALGEQRLVVERATRPFRAPESEALVGAPRTVYAVTLPADPDRGFISVYEFADDAAAASAAQAQARWLASGPGRVQAPLGTEHVIRRVGAAVVTFSWLPAAAEDPATPRIAEALRSIGTAVEVPS